MAKGSEQKKKRKQQPQQKVATRNAELSRRHRLWNGFSVMWSEICHSQLYALHVNERIRTRLVSKQNSSGEKTTKSNEAISFDANRFYSLQHTHTKKKQSPTGISAFDVFVRSSALEMPITKKTTREWRLPISKESKKHPNKWFINYNDKTKWIHRSICGPKFDLLFVCIVFFFVKRNQSVFAQMMKWHWSLNEFLLAPSPTDFVCLSKKKKTNKQTIAEKSNRNIQHKLRRAQIDR